MPDRPPARVRGAVDLLAPALVERPHARVLEVGCGVGHGLALLCALLPDGHVTGLDRSSSALAHAERRLARPLDEGRADLQHRDLTAFRPDRPYDAVLAVDVNAFWTDQAGPAAPAVRDLLAPGGVVLLAFSSPAGAPDERSADAVAAAAEALLRTGLDVTTGTGDAIGWVRGVRTRSAPGRTAAARR
ncbi:SAM-dependent methyltransferase [Cellulomonas marina]|uniref:Trans-aconitate 2-methyltransferase n=1 Tax=Cellulomonas marina TaxID=988821 RepID=A0A1I0V3J2_9CELL|nr:class I SAM-dependent methyltransferase [Cellulomonas marina]GIG28296.1 hypothetical protein Cma02nite_08960 [Cellulomonas marina]SFA70683.1 trans-aconitate 2-methyltransferase [Cellulomonas marina]